jgi:lipopolysaccharide/colanic/teichoic acid biosynthesis glycosyltransferase
MKRFLDLSFATVAALVLSPLLLLTAVAIWAETGSPVLFRQQRVGRYGQTFAMYKFRSMVKNAAAIGPYHTANNDARITRVGRFIRKTSIDELPQIINVLKGDMSLVGPRPDVPVQRADYTEAQWAQRCSVRPGITGLAQALYRSAATSEQRLALDLQYVQRLDKADGLGVLWLDIGVISTTVRQLFKAQAN